MTRPGLMLAIALGLAACTTTRTLPRPRSAEELQSLIADKRAQVTLLHGEPKGITSPGPPSLAPVAAPAEGDAGLPLADLSSLRGYEVKRRGLGAFEGLALGALLGFVAGAVIGLAVTSDDPPCDDPHLCVQLAARQKALLAGGLGAALGLVIGRQLGADIAHTDRYLFVNE